MTTLLCKACDSHATLSVCAWHFDTMAARVVHEVNHSVQFRRYYDVPCEQENELLKEKERQDGQAIQKIPSHCKLIWNSSPVNGIGVIKMGSICKAATPSNVSTKFKLDMTSSS